MRRSLALLLAATAVATPACSRASSEPAECRETFRVQHEAMTEYGNPGGPALPVLTARWDSLHDAFGRLGRSARAADCADLDRLSQTVESVEYVLVTADDVDMVARLERVEADLATAQRGGQYDPPPPEVTREIDTLRVAAPLVTTELAPQFAALDRTDPLDSDAVDAAGAALRAAAEGSEQYADCLEALEALDAYGLGDYEATLDSSR